MPDHATIPPDTTAARCDLVWHSSFASLTGYSGSALAYTLGLAARGVAVRPLYLYGADHDEQLAAGRLDDRIRRLQQQPLRLDVPQVVYAPGDRFSKNSGHYRIGFTMHEADRLPPSWVEQANQMDELWTPTAWGVETFRTSGIERPIHIIPLGIDPQHFSPGPPRAQLRERTIFLSIFEWGLRKGYDLLLRAYHAAFRPHDPVMLVLKIDNRAPDVHPLRVIADLLPSPAPPVGIIYNRPLSIAQLRELYQGVDCFVLPSRGEGWGMPILEAMACGVPAIATAWSGPTAFLDDTNGYPLPIRGLAAATAGGRYTRDAQWAEPDLDALVELLRRVAADPIERAVRGVAAAATARRWTWEHAVDRIMVRLAAW
ncbi:MAG TPA: glycosyltransferase [Roseiflexaceae bacterium]|nr:glycosyltransferase [Roseiflexaceae bacterium]HMP41588.1 glycosyltransferase [Roseiflexaceae bacterium]